MGYTGKKPTNVVDVSETQSLTVDGDLTISDKIIHSGDTNTAIRFPAADTVTVETGGSERARVASDGKVGIGLTDAASLLHVAGATADADGSLGSQSPQLIIEGGNTNNPFEIGMDNSGATAIGFLQSRNKSAGAQFISLNPAGGNVGIGTASPASLIHGMDGDLFLTDNSTSADSGQAVYFQSTTSGWSTSSAHAAIFGKRTDASNGYLRFDTRGSGTTAERFRIAANGMLTALGVYNITTSGAANVNVQSSGAILRSTSSEKYKQNIEDMELSYAQAILNLRPVYYKSKCDLDNDDHSHWGFIAEEVAKVDPRLVHYKTMDVTFKEVVDEDGKPTSEKIETILETPEPEGVQYDRLTPAIVKLLQEQQKTIESLEARVKTLEGQMASKARQLAQSASAPEGRKNLVINGAMQVAQRGTSATGINTSGYYTVDRIDTTFSTTAGELTMSQDSDAPDGFANALKLDCTTADTSIAADEIFLLMYQFEGQDVQRIQKGKSTAKEVTVSFYAKANASKTYVVELKDFDNTRTCSKTFTVGTSYARHEITFPADTTGVLDDDNARSFSIHFFLHAGSTYTGGTLQTAWGSQVSANRAPGIGSFFDSTDNTFFITGLQMEIGSVATEFEHRSFAEELALCQRYFIRFPSLSDASTTLYYNVGMIHSSTKSFHNINLPVPMRTQPDLSISGTDDFVTVDSGTVRNLTNLTILGDDFIDNQVVTLQGTATFPNEDRPAALRGDGTSGGHFALDAEL